MDEIRLQKRKSKAENEGNNGLLTSTCAELSELYMKSGQFHRAIDEYKTLAEVYKSEHNQIQYAKANRGIGEAYLGLHKYKKALEHQNIYLNIVTTEKDEAEIQRAYATLGHIYLTTYLETLANPEKNLNAAYKYFMRSMKICESLNGINKLEKADMQARLFSNLGLVKESLGDYIKAAELFTTSINICKNNDIYEQLNRGYMSLASLYEKQGDSGKTMHHYNLAIEATKKLTGNVDLKCATLLIQSEALIKLGDFHAAKKSLYKAYKLNSPNIQDKQNIEDYLRTVATMCYTEEKIVAETNDNGELKKLYEKMGDCACSVKNYGKALEYYKLMLNYAEKSGISGKDLAICYNSLAQTYEDNKLYKEAVECFEKEYYLRDTLKDCLDALSKIADNKESADEDVNEVVNVYNEAIQYCQKHCNLKEESRMISRCIKYLKRVKNETEAFKFEQQLNALKVPDNEESSSDSDSCVEQDNLIRLEDITDSDDSDRELESVKAASVGVGKRRSKKFLVKKNTKGESQLHVACINEKIPVVKHLLEQGHPVNVRDNSGWLPIHEASNHGYYEIVKLLLDKGASINDRGGVKCEGITPIFDAANNGHLQVVELLLDRGASVTIKTDNWDTPLNVLRLWHQKYPFVGQEYDLYQKLVDRMTEALKKVGQKVNENVVVHKPIDGDTEEYNFVEDDSSEKSEDDNDSDRDSGSSSGDCYPRQPSPYLLDEYQAIMKNLGKKSTKIKDKETKPTFGKKSALIRERNLLIDDWLDEDVQPAKAIKKRKTNSMEAVVTSSSRKTSSTSSRNSSPMKHDENRHINSNIPITSPGPSKRRSSMTDTKNSANVKRKIQSSLLEAGINRTTNIIKNRASSNFQRHRSLDSTVKQQRITAFGNSLVEADSTVSLSSKFPVTQVPTISATQVPITQESVTNVPALSTGALMVYVDVKIEGKVFRVPVLLSQVQSNTIGWLADHAAQKYARKEYSKPYLELETTSGALLSDEDPLSLLFPLGTTQAEPVVGRIVKFYVTPLVGRYKEACSHMKEDIDENLTTLLEEVSVKLNIQNRGFLNTTLSSLCKALNHQTTLLDLNISGNFLDINCMVILCASLPTLVNLTSLNLRCTGLTSSHLTEIVKMFSRSSERVLEKLKHLDLSDNYLKNKSFQHIVEILKHLKLEQLNIANVAFSKGVFEEFDNFNLDLLDIRSLNISDNQLNTSDIEKIISWTKISKLTNLNVSRNCFSNMRLRCSSEGFQDNNLFLSLESLNLSRCKLLDNDLYDLLRLCTGKSLTKIDLSYNSNLTGISLRRLLENYTLQEINLIGCDSIFEYFLEFCAEDLVQQSKRNIKISTDFSRYATQVETLIQGFKKMYVESTIEKGNSLMLLYSKDLET